MCLAFQGYGLINTNFFEKIKLLIKIVLDFPLGSEKRHRNFKWVKKFVTLNKHKVSIIIHYLLNVLLPFFQDTVGTVFSNFKIPKKSPISS